MLLAKAGPAFYAGLGSFGSANTAHTKNPAGAGFFGAADASAEGCEGSGGLLQRLDARGQAALVTGSLVLVDQAARAEAVQDRLGYVEGGLGAGGVVGVQRLEHFLDGGTKLRTLAVIARIAHDGLLGALLGGLDICHGGYPRKSMRETLVGEMRKNEREIMVYSNTCVKSGVCLP